MILVFSEGLAHVQSICELFAYTVHIILMYSLLYWHFLNKQHIPYFLEIPLDMSYNIVLYLQLLMFNDSYRLSRM